MANVTWRDYWQIEDTDEDGYGTSPYYPWYGLWLLVFAGIGCAGNLVALIVYVHPRMRSPYGVFISALLAVDIMFLVSTTLTHVPGAWLTQVSTNDPEFSDQLASAQDIYVMSYGATELARALVVWYTVAVLAEQYCVIYKPATTLRFSSTTDKALKICITILNLTILVHLVHFFKIVLKSIDIGDHNRICLSDIYIYDAYRMYDVYGYFICFVLSAWFVALAFCILIATAVITSRYNIGEVLPDQRIFRIFKNGRSIRTSLALGIWFLLCSTMSNISYMATWVHKAWDSADIDCHFRPADRRFTHTPDYYQLLFDIPNVLNSMFRLPMLCIVNSSFRRLLLSCFQRNHDAIKSVSTVLRLPPPAQTSSPALTSYHNHHQHHRRHRDPHQNHHQNPTPRSTQVQVHQHPPHHHRPDPHQTQLNQKHSNRPTVNHNSNGRNLVNGRFPHNENTLSRPGPSVVPVITVEGYDNIVFSDSEPEPIRISDPGSFSARSGHGHNGFVKPLPTYNGNFNRISSFHPPPESSNVQLSRSGSHNPPDDHSSIWI